MSSRTVTDDGPKHLSFPRVHVVLGPRRGAREWRSAAVASLAAYFCSSLFIVYLNKWLFSSRMPYPVTVSWLQQGIALAVHTSLWCLAKRWAFAKPFAFPRPTLREAIRTLPVSIAFVGMVALSNLALLHAQVSTYQVSRSLTLVFTIILSFLVLGQRQSCQVLMACGVVVSGFVVVALDSAALSAVGAALGAASSLSQAFYNVGIKFTLPVVSEDPLILLLHTTAWGCVLFPPCAIGIEGFGRIVEVLRNQHSELPLILLSGVSAYVLNLTSYWCVRVTSPVTFNVTGLAKAAVQALGGIVFLGDVATVQGCAGIALKFGGSAWYGRAKMVEARCGETRTTKAGTSEDKEEEGGLFNKV